MTISERYTRAGGSWKADPLRGVVLRNHRPQHWGVSGGARGPYVASYCTAEDAILIAAAPEMADLIERYASEGDPEAARIMRILLRTPDEHVA